MKSKILWMFVAITFVCALSSISGKLTASDDPKDDNSDAWKQAKTAYAQAVLEVAQADLGCPWFGKRCVHGKGSCNFHAGPRGYGLR
jgi:hypothetical protein